ncbi:diacylglycerol/lipid kinase family protein [Tautonia rosea]|uniref:diacylglycerol/lipid kinase family protein n=1 Tax=Tautonia rosea TaxID=2728037 RepID=UPI001474598A|nr:diacylglycerol kinase family protein [Tautonia rosea]
MVEDGPRPGSSDDRNHDAAPITTPRSSIIGPEFKASAWVGLIANANSGVGAGRDRVARLVRALKRKGLECRVAWSPADRLVMVDQASRSPSCRCLVAVGGDGTVSALINEHPTVPICVLPAGTENLFARHFGLSRHPEEAAETIAHGRAISLDLGAANDRRFALMAGIGFDAEIVTRHHLARVGHSQRVRPTSRVAYVEPVLRASFEYEFPTLTVRVEDPEPAEVFSGSIAFVFNLPSYALGLPIAPTAREDDGLLDLVVFRDPGPLAALHYLWLIFRGLHLDRPGVWHRRVRRVSVSSDVSIPVQLDGDPGGSINPSAPTPWTAQVLPRAVTLLVPASYSNSMLVS